MVQQVSPFLEAAYGWNYGEGGWNYGMDQNLLKFSFMFDRNVDSIVASLPPAVNGQAHYLTTDNRLYFAVGNVYFSAPTPKWFTIAVRSTGDTWQFDGISLLQIDTPQQLNSRIDAVELTVSSLGTAAFEDVEFFATQSQLDVAVATAANYTDSLRGDVSNTTDMSKGAAIIGRGAQIVDSVVELRTLLKTSPSKYAFSTGYDSAGDGGHGEYFIDESDTTTPDNGGTCIVAADGGRWKLVHKGTVSVRQFGATGGVTNATAAFTAAVQSGVESIFVPVGTYMLSDLVVPDGVTITGASVRDSVLKKFASGRVIQSLGRHSKLLNLKIDGGGVGLTGNSVEISLGDNVPEYINQGQQLIEGCWFANGNGYHVAYTAANKGYQSKVLRCIFDEPLGAGGLAAILWPDEPQNGGNRYVQTCYSSGPLVNLNGCDNGHITECIVGAGTKGGEQGILMPTGTVNSAKKAFIADNRFAVADLSMVFRGSSHTVTGNSFAATVTLSNTFTGSLFSDNLTTQPIVDSLGDTSGTQVYHSQAVTPNFRSAGGGALIGNAVVSGLIEWKGLSKYYSGKFKFGSTTNFGTGQFITDLVGSVSGTFGFSGGWQALDSNTSNQWDGSIFCPPGGSNSLAFADRGNSVNAAYPFTWAVNDELHWEARVR